MSQSKPRKVAEIVLGSTTSLKEKFRQERAKGPHAQLSVVETEARHEQTEEASPGSPPSDEEESSYMRDQNPAQLGLSLVAEAGVVTSFAAMSALQRVQGALRSLKDSVSRSSAASLGIEEKATTSFSNPLAGPIEVVAKPCSLMACKHARDSNLWKLELIRNAQSSIEISGNYCGGKVFQQALEIMAERLSTRKAMEVHILCSPELIQSKNMAAVSRLRKLFPRRFHFLLTKTLCRNVLRKAPGDLKSRENHVKAVIVDQKYFVVGGTNFEEHMGTEGIEDQSVGLTATMYERFVLTASRDMDCVGFGKSIAKKLRQGFFELYKNWLVVMDQEYHGLRFITHNRPERLAQRRRSSCLASSSDEVAVQQRDPAVHEEVAELLAENAELSLQLEKLKSAFDFACGQDGTELPPVLVETFSEVFLRPEDSQQMRRGVSESNDAPPSEQKEEQSELNDLHDDSDWVYVQPKYWEDDVGSEVIQFNARELKGENRVEDEVGCVKKLETHPELVENVMVKALFSSWIFSTNSVDFAAANYHSYKVPTTDEYIRTIEDAQFSLTIAHLNINPAPALMDALLDAVNRGVHVRILTTAANTSTTLASHFYSWANRVNYLPILTGVSYFEDKNEAAKFVKETVSIFEYAVERTTFHKKVLVADEKIVLVGSYNLSQKSHYGDDELLLNIESPAVARQFLDVLELDITNSRQIPPKDVLGYYFSWLSRFLGDTQSGRVARLIG